MTYRGEPNGPSFFRDMAALATRGPDVDAAVQRLSGAGRRPAYRVLIAPTTAPLTRDVLPPVWLTREFARLTGEMRGTSRLMRAAELPTGVESIDVILAPEEHASRAEGAERGNVKVRDLTEAAVQAAVKTYSAVQTVSAGLLTYAPVNPDRVIVADLAAGYTAQLDRAVLGGRSAGARGVLAVAGVSQLTYADSEPTTAELYIALADAVQRSTRDGVPDAIVMHPRRWEWINAGWGAIDARVRTSIPGHSASTALLDPPSHTRGAVGVLVGLPVYVDESMPATKGPSRNEDRIVVGRFADSMLAEGPIWVDVVENDSAGFPQADIHICRSAAFSWSGNPGALAVVGGSGLVDPYPAGSPRRRTPTKVAPAPGPQQTPPTAAAPHGTSRTAHAPSQVTEPAADQTAERPLGIGRESLLNALLPEIPELAGVRDTAEVVLAASLERVGADAGCLLLPDANTWRVSAGAGLRPLEHRLCLGADHWLVEEVVRRRHGLLIQESDIARSRLADAPLAHSRHLIAVPIREVDGIIMLSRTETPFTESDLRSIAAVAEEADPLLRSALLVRRCARALAEHADEA